MNRPGGQGKGVHKDNRVVLCGYYGYGNGGDEALLAALLQMLPSQVSPLVLSGNPALTTQLHQVEACDRYQPLDVLRGLGTSSGFIWGGGSLIQDATSGFSPFYYAGLMALSQKLGLKTVAWAQGIGPLYRSRTRWLAEQVFRGCTAVSVRDGAALELLNQWHIPALQAADPVWALAASPVPALADLPLPRVAVVLRAHPQLTPSRLTALADGLKSFQAATGAFVLLVPFQASQDLEISAYLHRLLPEVSQIIQLEDPRQLKGVFRGVEMTIAMRLHGLIMAAAEGCRCFALSYDPKVSQLMAALQFPGWLLTDIPATGAEVCQTWLEHYANGSPLTSDQIAALVDQALIHRDLLAEVFLPK